MKIAINCAFFQPKGGGIKEYIQNLIENLSAVDNTNEYVIYVLQDQRKYSNQNLNIGSNFKLKEIPFKSSGIVNKIYRSLFDNRFWLREERLEKWDLFHSTFFHGPKLKHTPLLLTVHDMRFFRFPETYTFLRYSFLKRAVKKSISRANHIISISDFTKSEICEAYNVDAKKITTIHEAINLHHFSLQPLTSNNDKLLAETLSVGKFILTVGHMEPRKNYNRLIKAFEKIRPDENLKLVIVGKKTHDYEETLKLIESNPNVIYLNFVSDALLNWLYKNAQLFIFPSIYEGFGFPPLEAAAHGTISAVSNVSSMPEVCGNAVCYFDPYSIDDIASTINKLLNDSDLRSSLHSKSKSQLQNFSWKTNAEETITVYKNVVENTK